MKSFFDNYSWKQKNTFLWWGALLFAFIVYQASIKHTLTLRSTYRNATSLKIANAQTEQELATLKERLSHNGFNLTYDEQDIKAYTLHQVALAAENNRLNVKNVPVTRTISADGLQVHYDAYDLTGSYHDLLKGWYALEQDQKITIVSISFKKENHSVSRQPELKMGLITAHVSREEKMKQ